MAVTRIKNNQIFDATITAQKIAPGTLVGSLFSPNLVLNSNVTVAGNLSVIGTSSTISSTNTYVNDPIIVFNNGYTGAPTYDVGILVNRNLNPYNTAWVWSESQKSFVGVYTTESGGTTGSINNSGYANVKIGELTALSNTQIGDLTFNGTEISPVLTNADIKVFSSGTGSVLVNSTILPNAVTANIGSATAPFNDVFANVVTVGTSVITTAGGNLSITPPVGGSVTVANLSISGTNNTFSGTVVSGNATITGGTINGTSIGQTAAAAGTFTSIVDYGDLTVNGSNATVSLQPAGTGTVNINPGSTGSINNMSASLTTLSTSGATTLADTTATSLTTANAQITGGAVSGVTIANSPISGSTGSFTELSASGNTTLSTTTVSGITSITDATQSTVPTDGALVVAGGVGVGKDVNVGGNLVVAQTSTFGSIVVAGNSIGSTGDVAISATGSVKVGALTLPQVDGVAGSVLTSDGAGNLALTSIGSAVSGNLVPLGTPTVGTLVDNLPAITTFTAATKVTDAVDKLNEILGKLVPPQPPAFPNGALSIQSLSSGLRMTDFTQTNNTITGSKQLAAGSTVGAYRRLAAYSTNVLNDVGPGESGTLTVYKNGVAAGSRTIVPTLTNNGTYDNLIVSDNSDYGVKSSTALRFWNSFDAQASGFVTAGWNEVYITDSAAGTTNTPVWYYDASAPGTPVVTAGSFAPTSEVTAFSSSVPHYTSTTAWTLGGTANRLSGDLYPATDTFLTGTAGGSFQTPASVTYTAAGITVPLVQNLYVASGSAAYSTVVNTVDVTGSSTAGPSVTASNSYASGSGTATPGGTVLTIKVSDTSKVNENNVTVGTFGTGGSSSAVRIGGFATGATPATTGATAWTSSAVLPAYEAAVVAGTAKADTTNYSTGYYPVGPDLSGRAATQYITFRIQRDAVSKFNISVTGKFSGCHVAMPGSSLDTTAAPTNGWVDATVSYAGAGVPGTGTGGNGNAGCALGGVLVTGSSTTQSKTVTFGTESSFNSTNKYIYVRFVLGSSDSITALSFTNPTN